MAKIEGASDRISKRRFLKLMGATALAGPAILHGRLAGAQGRRKVKLGHGIAVIDPSAASWDSAGNTGGFWQDEGLDVEILGFNGASPAYHALLHGEIDVAMSGSPDLMRLREEDVGVKVIASVYDRNHAYPAVPIESSIKSIEDFCGKTAGLQTLTGSPPVWLRTWLQAHNMTMKDLAGAIPVGTGAPALHALSTGQIDILALYHGQYALFEGEFGLKLRKFDHDPAVVENAFVQVLVTNEKTIKDEPQMLAALMRGMAKGIVFADENPKAAARGHYKQFPRTLSPGANIEEAVTKAGNVIKLSGAISIDSARAGQWGMSRPDQIERVRDIMVDGKILNKKLPWQDYYTPQFIADANKFKIEDVIAKAKAAT